jgi:hypothetical protein
MTTETAPKTAPRQRKLSIATGDGAPKRSRKKADDGQKSMTELLDKSKAHLGTGGGDEGQTSQPEKPETGQPNNDTPDANDAAPGETGSAEGTPAGDLPEVGTEIMRAGIKKVAITVVPLSGRGGRNVAPELFPFGELTPSVRRGKEIIGPSFFIPEGENPDSLIASARKRHKKFNFLTRKLTEQVDGEGPEVKGVRIWRAPDTVEAPAA